MTINIGTTQDAAESYSIELEDGLSKDDGFAAYPNTIDKLKSLDDAEWLRCEKVLRRHKCLTTVKKLMKPEKVQAIGQRLIKDIFPNAPVDDLALVPVGWEMEPPGNGCYSIIHNVVTTEGTKSVQVCHAPVVISRRLIDHKDWSTHLEISWLIDNKWRKQMVKRDKLMVNRSLVENLAGYGCPVNSNNASEIMQYLTDYEAANRDVMPKLDVSSQMGWQGGGFIVGDKCIGGKVKFSPGGDGERQMVSGLKPAGTFDAWAEAIKPIAEFPRVELAIYASLAPPLLEILKAPNFVIDYCYKTSSGKTTTMGVAASVWGVADINDADSIISSWDMTQVAMERRAAVYNGLPLLIDDTKRAKVGYGGQSVVVDAIYAITNGKGRSRGSISGTQKLSQWRTIMITTGEQKSVDFDKSGGAPARTITLWGNPFGESTEKTAELIRQMRHSLMDNYGHAGPKFVRYITENRDLWDEWRDEHRWLSASYEKRMAELVGGNTADLGVISRTAINLATLEITGELAHEALELPWEYESPVEDILRKSATGARVADREIEAIKHVASVAAANKGKFLGGLNDDKYAPGSGWMGWWDGSKKWDFIAFFPHVIKEILEKEGYEPKSIIARWAEIEAIKTEGSRAYSKVSGIDGRPRMLVIKRAALEKYTDFGM